jgi:hypothetical protein
VIVLLSPLTVMSKVPKSALAVQIPGWGRLATLGEVTWGVGVVDGAEGVGESPPHAVAAIANESRSGTNLTRMTTSCHSTEVEPSYGSWNSTLNVA